MNILLKKCNVVTRHDLMFSKQQSYYVSIFMVNIENLNIIFYKTDKCIEVGTRDKRLFRNQNKKKLYFHF